jgi:nucleotide-binding universal stress UspA family protein
MRFLVPLDVHGCADKVVERALWLARLAPDARLDLLTVAPPLAAGVDSIAVGDRTFALGGLLDESTAALLRGFAVLAQKNNVLGDVSASNGAPVDAILSAVRQRDVDLVIMGSHARTGLARVVFGSVAESVLRQSPVPVLIEPAGRGRDEHPADVVVQAEAERSG